MPSYKKLINVKESIDTDLQLLACEIEVSVKDMRVFSDSFTSDCIEEERFRNFYDSISKNGDFINSFDGNTSIYEYEEMPIVLHETLDNRYIMFPIEYAVHMEKLLENSCDHNN